MMLGLVFSQPHQRLKKKKSFFENLHFLCIAEKSFSSGHRERKAEKRTFHYLIERSNLITCSCTFDKDNFCRRERQRAERRNNDFFVCNTTASQRRKTAIQLQCRDHYSHQVTLKCHLFKQKESFKAVVINSAQSFITPCTFDIIMTRTHLIRYFSSASCSSFPHGGIIKNRW